MGLGSFRVRVFNRLGCVVAAVDKHFSVRSNMLSPTVIEGKDDRRYLEERRTFGYLGDSLCDKIPSSSYSHNH